MRADLRHLRLAVVLSHPIQYYAPWHARLTARENLSVKVFFCHDAGSQAYLDPDFNTEIRWDIPLLTGYDYEVLPGGQTSRALLGGWDNPSVGEALDRFHPDVVQVFGYAHRTMWRTTKWATRNHVPILLFSDSNDRNPRGVLRNSVKSVVVGRFYSGIDGALFTSEANREYHERYGLPRRRLYKAVMPVDLSRFRLPVKDKERARIEVRDRFGIPRGSFLVGYVGKLTPGKRVGDLVQAVQHLDHNDPPVHAVLVGDGPERGGLEGTLRRTGTSNVHITGFVNQSQVPEYLAAIDVLAAPSEFEAYSMSVAEAVAVGTPVIVSERVGCIGSDGAARPGVNAYVHRLGDIEAIRSAIVALQHDPANRQRMRAASLSIGEGMDLGPASRALEDAVVDLSRLGKRSRKLQ